MLNNSISYILFVILISPIIQASTSSQDYYYTCMKNAEDSEAAREYPLSYYWQTEAHPEGIVMQITSGMRYRNTGGYPDGYGTSCPLTIGAQDSGSATGGSGSGSNGGPGGGTAGGTCGSYIDYNTLSLTEKIPIFGTNFNFVYSSNRGHRDREFRVDINTCSKDAAIGSTYSCDVSLNVAGKVYSQTVNNTSPQDTVSFFWDGSDSSNNKLNFARDAYTVYNDFNTAGQTINVPVTLGFYDAAMYGLQGWTIDALHAYDSTTHTIHFGDGTYARANVIEPYPSQYFVKSVDGSEIYRFSGDGRHTETINGFTNKLIYSFSYDGSGKLIAIQDVFGKTVTIQRASGKVISITSPYSLVTNLTTDSNGNVTSLSTPGGKTFDMTYWNTKGLMKTFKKPGSLATQFAYDTFGNLTQDLNATGRSVNLSAASGTNFSSIDILTTLGILTNYTVSTGLNSNIKETKPTGNVIFTTRNNDDSDTVSSSAGSLTTSFKNGSGVVVKDARGFNIPFSILTSTNQSTLNYTVKPSETATFINGDIFNPQTYQWSSQVGSKTSTLTYNDTTKSFTATTPVGRSSTNYVNVNGNTSQISIPNTTSTTYSYDNDGRLSSITRGQRQTSFAYNTSGFLASVTDPGSQTTGYSYDLDGHVTGVTLPDLRTISYAYDGRGNKTSVTPPGRSPYTFSFDSFESNTSLVFPPLVPSLSKSIQYEYDLDANLTKITKPDLAEINYSYSSTTGQLYQVTSPEGARSFNYDQINNLTSFSLGSVYGTRVYDGHILKSESLFNSTNTTSLNPQVDYTYNSEGKNTAVKVSNGSTSGITLNKTYDNDGLLKTIGTQTLNYNAQNGFLESVVNGNFTGTYTYNLFGEIATYEAKYSTTVLYSYTLTYNDLGKIISKSETIQGVTDNYAYTYDITGRLLTISKNGSTISNYTYDSNGNRTGSLKNGASFTASYNSNEQLTSFGNQTFSYNDNGEMITRNTAGAVNTFGYDDFGNLKSVLATGLNLTYQLDPLGRRLVKKSGVLLSNVMIYDGILTVGELNTNNTIKRIYAFGSQAHSPDYYRQSNVNYQMIKDHLGSIRLVINNSTGAIQQRLDYDEWGKVTAATNYTTQPFGFAGGNYDSLTKLYVFGARTYDPETGRWTTRDPIGFNGGDTNLYGYVLNDPINAIDPEGKVAIYIAAPIIGGLVGGFVGGITSVANGGGWVGFKSGAATGAVGGAAAGLGLATGLGAAAATAAGLAASTLTALPDSGVNPADLGNGFKRLLSPPPKLSCE